MSKDEIDTRWQRLAPVFVCVAPLLAEWFPRAQFVFTHRNGITNVHSGIKLWEDTPDVFQIICHGWADTTSAWREGRKSLNGRHIEIAQEEMASRPSETAIRLTDILQMLGFCQRARDLFRSRRVYTAFPDKSPSDYHCRVDWSPEQKAYFIEICQEEMEIWGYDMDFDSPRGVWENSLQR